MVTKSNEGDVLRSTCCPCGHQLEPTRIMTHFESDYGASPKVEMHELGYALKRVGIEWENLTADRST